MNGMRAWMAVLLAATLGLGACATRPEGLLRPTGWVAPGASTVDILAGTTRAPSSDPGVLFSGERDSGEAPSIEHIVVSIPPDATRKAGEIQWPKHKVADPAKEFATVSVAQFDSVQARDWFRASKTAHGRLLIFVHGYNTPFDGGVYLLAQIVHDSHMQVAPVLFSWPSRGQVLSYNYDRESAAFSRTALENLLDAASEDDEVQDITLLGHSMGAWLTMEALRDMTLRHGRVSSKIHNVILASPDIDVDVFRQQYQDLGYEHPHLTVMISRDDRALNLSRIIAGNVDRLGGIDVTKEPYRSRIKLIPDMTVIDLTDLRTDDQTNHVKFAESPEIVQLLGVSLINKQPLADSRLTLRESLGVIVAGVGRTVNRTAAAVVDVPFMLTDKQARQDAATNVKAAGAAAENTVKAVEPKPAPAPSPNPNP